MPHHVLHSVTFRFFGNEMMILFFQSTVPQQPHNVADFLVRYRIMDFAVFKAGCYLAQLASSLVVSLPLLLLPQEWDPYLLLFYLYLGVCK